MNYLSPWKTTPRRTSVIFLLAVFFVFTGIGFINDMLDMGRQPAVRFGIEVVLTGLFAVGYSIAGITLRGRFWIVCVPLFALQFISGFALANVFPDAAMPRMMDAAGLGHLRNRLTFDGVGAIITICLGYAGLVVVSISEARRYARSQAEKASLEAEMAAARQVQQVILPEPGAVFPGYKVESVYRPAQQVGGDFFQMLQADGGMLVVVGDVAGKGLPAAMLVSMLVGVIRATADATHDPAMLLGKLHDRLLGHSAGGFSTALAAYIAADGEVTIANAGHLSPYLDGREVELPGALPLGVDGGGRYESVRLALPAGSQLTFLSDGVVEAQSASGELFGFDRAKAISRQAAAAIADEAVRFGQEDDITVVTVEREAAAS